MWCRSIRCTLLETSSSSDFREEVRPKHPNAGACTKSGNWARDAALEHWTRTRERYWVLGALSQRQRGRAAADQIGSRNQMRPLFLTQ